MRIALPLLLALVAAAPLSPAAAQQAPLPPGTQSPDAPQSAPAAAAKPGAPTLQTRPIDPALAAVEDQIDAHQYDAARPALLRYLEQHPADARALFDQGYIEDSTGQQKEAEASYRKAIAADPRQFEAHAALGLLLAQEGGAPADAEAELKAAMALEPATHDAAPRAQVWRTLAQLQVAQDPAAARDSLLQALKLEPGQTRPADLLLTARIAEANGDDPTAETAYRRALAAEPGSRDATAGLAHLLLKQEKPAEAEELLREALAKAPADPALNAQMASVLAGQGKLDEATATLEKLHAQQPADPAIGRMLGDAYLQAGAPEKALPLFGQALQTAPNDVELLNSQGQCLILTKRFADAIPVLRHATELDAQDVEALNGLAFAYTQNHEDAMALKVLASRSKIVEDTPATLFLWATSYDNVHQSQRAAEYYRRFLQAASGKYPDEEWQARHRLIALGKP